jgi:hypothetical protein
MRITFGSGEDKVHQRGAKCALYMVSTATMGCCEKGTPGAANGSGRCTHDRRLRTVLSTSALRDTDSVRDGSVKDIFPVVALEMVLVKLNDTVRDGVTTTVWV